MNSHILSQSSPTRVCKKKQPLDHRCRSTLPVQPASCHSKKACSVSTSGCCWMLRTEHAGRRQILGIFHLDLAGSSYCNAQCPPLCSPLSFQHKGHYDRQCRNTHQQETPERGVAIREGWSWLQKVPLTIKHRHKMPQNHTSNFDKIKSLHRCTRQIHI